MTITKQTVADKIAAYLHHEITRAQLVDCSPPSFSLRAASTRQATAPSKVNYENAFTNSGHLPD
jgi:hypothetical protein